jgi:hypothetical protein
LVFAGINGFCGLQPAMTMAPLGPPASPPSPPPSSSSPPHALTMSARPAAPTIAARRPNDHRLAPATVSYHLGVLHDAGLVMRSRHRRLVLYRRSEQAASLLGESTAS